MRLAVSHRGIWTGVALGALALLALLCTVPRASAQTVEFQGKTVVAPDSWPVYRLSEHPGMCVRLDRRAVYLGTPSSQQRCPAGAIGKRRAIVVEGRAAARAAALPRAPRRSASASATGAVFTGLGFDACSAPSSKSMAAWADSPYRAIGVYIGGENRACSQPNLTSGWVEEQTAEGWHLIPTYVGLQAPTSACSSCSKVTTIGAVKQGEEEAIDAVAAAAEVGIGPGSPIYFDMEAYSRTTSATNATLAFLESWTEKVRALGYVSGVYSSSSSGIADLGEQLGSGYTLPDNLWIANWNGQKNTLDPAVPSTGWTLHQRIHQYQGGHNESYGGVTINIDSNYVDAATVGIGGPVAAVPAEDDPIGELNLTAASEPGVLRVKGWAFDPNSPTSTSAIRVVVGGEAGTPGADEVELGSIANIARRAVGFEHPEAGPNHGFDTRLATTASGSQSVCVYALDYDPGEDTLLGCKATQIPVAVTITHVRQTRRGVRAWLNCAWPEGTTCPGWLALRTRYRIAIPRRGKPPRIQTVTRTLGRRSFHLAGRRGHGFEIPLSKGGRAILQTRGKLRTQFIATIPGGKRTVVVGLEQKAR